MESVYKAPPPTEEWISTSTAVISLVVICILLLFGKSICWN